MLPSANIFAPPGISHCPVKSVFFRLVRQISFSEPTSTRETYIGNAPGPPITYISFGARVRIDKGVGYTSVDWYALTWLGPVYEPAKCAQFHTLVRAESCCSVLTSDGNQGTCCGSGCSAATQSCSSFISERLPSNCPLADLYFWPNVVLVAPLPMPE